MKENPTEWEKIFTNDMLDKMLITKICKYLIQHNRKNSNNSIKKQTVELNGCFPKKEMQMANRNMKGSQHH